MVECSIGGGGGSKILEVNLFAFAYRLFMKISLQSTGATFRIFVEVLYLVLQYDTYNLQRTRVGHPMTK